MEKVTLFNSSGPDSKITIISRKKCSQTLLQTCNVPIDAREEVGNGAEVILLKAESIFVRGVNSSFYVVEVNGDDYYVHEQYIRRVKDNTEKQQKDKMRKVKIVSSRGDSTPPFGVSCEKCSPSELMASDAPYLSIKNISNNTEAELLSGTIYMKESKKYYFTVKINGNKYYVPEKYVCFDNVDTFDVSNITCRDRIRATLDRLVELRDKFDSSIGYIADSTVHEIGYAAGALLIETNKNVPKIKDAHQIGIDYYNDGYGRKK